MPPRSCTGEPMYRGLLLPLCLAALTPSTYAELQALDDQSLSEHQGAGIALALEDFVFDVNDAITTVTGIESSDETQTLEILWTDLYIMGEGSENGTAVPKPKAQIGSLLHPWLIQSLRGSGGLDVNDPQYNEDYIQFGSDIALLEVATDSYKNPVESTPTWGLFSVYQGCVWGQAGCDDSNIAYNNITTVVDDLNDEVVEIETKYQNVVIEYDGWLSPPDEEKTYTLQEMQYSIDYNLAVDVANQEEVIAQEEADVDYAWSGTDGVEDNWGSLDEEQRDPDDELYVPIGYYIECGEDYECDANDDDYNDALGVYHDENVEYSEAKEDLARIYTDDKLESITYESDNPESEPNGNKEVIGVSLQDRMEDLSRYRTLCGADSIEESSCSDGLIIYKEGQQGDIEKISIALSDGVNRRKGLDIGSKFTFKFRNADDPNVVERTDYIDIDMKGVYVDGSHFRLWSREDQDGNAELNANISLNLYAKEININTCGEFCDNDQIDIAEREAARENATLYIDNFLLDLNLGYGEVQPVKLSTTSDGNFVLELQAPEYDTWINEQGETVTNAQQVYKDYYREAPKSNLFIGNIQLGSDPSKNLGSITVDGLRATYLKVTSHDI